VNRFAGRTPLILFIGAGTLAAFGAEPPVAVPEPSEAALRLYWTGNWVWAFGQFWAVAVPAALAFGGYSARARDLGLRLTRGRWYPTFAVVLVAVLGLKFAIDLPWNYYRGYIRPHAYGLSVQTPSRWIGEELKQLGVTLAVGLIFAWVPFALMARSPRRWWLWCALLYVPFLVATLVVKPIAIDPLFNRFGPMRDRALESRILSLADRAGIEGSRVYEVDKSRDTTMVNAYVTGLFGSRRVVLWDTLLAKLRPREVLFIMGHEMGHYALGHVARGALLSVVVVLASLGMIDQVGRRVVDRWGPRLGVEGLADPASLPIVLILLQLALLVATPAISAYSRIQEHEADRFALELTRSNRDGALAFVKLQGENLSNPRPGALYVFWRASHPPLGDRIDFCNTYRPWEMQGRSRYAGYFRPARPRD